MPLSSATAAAGITPTDEAHSPALKERPGLGLQQPDQRRIHVFEFVRNVEADDPLRFEIRLELLRQLVAVRALHDEDDLCPLEQLGRNRCPGFRIETGRCDLE